MKLKFDSNLEYQQEAIKSVVDLFKGQQNNHQDISFIAENGVIPNELDITEKHILHNLQEIQKENKINENSKLDGMDFSVEMETGTGKTYVYLRSILELNKEYGFKKFIIIVPSVAIREGVLKTLEITKQHFKQIYDNISYNFCEYDSTKLSRIRQFSRNNNVEILVMTLDSFNKKDNINIIDKNIDRLSGQKPIDLISKTRPLLLLDEPQNMESENSKRALSKLNPLLKLRYSATHKNYYNLIYRLTPVDAYQKGLVKKIEVLSVVKEDDYNGPYIKLLEIRPDKRGPKAKIEINRKLNQGYKKDKIIVDGRSDLFSKTKNSDYKGIKVSKISMKENGLIEFTNGLRFELGQDNEIDKEELMRQQIKSTIKNHFEKSKEMLKEGIKVLSLFFIDKVDNYFNEEGIIRKIFEEEFNKIKKEYPGQKNLDAKEVHKGYFAKNKKGDVLQQDMAIEKNKEAFDLIMKNKERLLSLDEPVQFIFSHSALKEGWDNPNIFNICTLRDTKSEMRKRQEIGRGVRLPVNQKGERLTEKEFLLTVVANESYMDYVDNLQREYEEEGIFNAPKPENANKQVEIKLRKDFDKDPNFKELWKKISKKTDYSIRINSEKLISSCIEEINNLEINKPSIRTETAELEYKKEKEKEKIDYFVKESSFEEYRNKYSISNILEEITQNSGLTRQTTYEILSQINALDKIFINPNEFIQKVINIISHEISTSQISEIEYELNGEDYSLNKFAAIKTYSGKIIKSDNKQNSIYEAVVFDSDGEKDLAEKLSRDQRIELFFKLPAWFFIDTPIGTYNPDWAVVFKQNEGKRKVCFVSETKFVKDEGNLRPTEQNKIKCAEKHFDTLDTDYFLAKSSEELIRKAERLD